jgi:hypothetical protein
MHQHNVAQLNRAVCQEADPYVRWFTTYDAARALHVTAEGVRHLVRTGQLRCEWTPSRRRILRAHEVLDLAARRAHARLLLVHTTYRKRGGAVARPRQLVLFHLHLFSVSPPTKSLGVRQAKDGRSAPVFGHV